LVRFLKRNVTAGCGENIWQRSYYDHIIRDHDDYLRVCEYIDMNPAKWVEDPYHRASSDRPLGLRDEP